MAAAKTTEAAAERATAAAAALAERHPEVVEQMAEHMVPSTGPVSVWPAGDAEASTDAAPTHGGQPVEWSDTPAAVAAEDGLADAAAEAAGAAVESGELEVMWESDPQVWGEGWAAGFLAGQDAGLAARPPRSVRIPVPMRHSLLTAGDAIEDRGGRVRLIHRVRKASEHPSPAWRMDPRYRGRLIVELSRVDPGQGTLEYDADPDEPAQVFVTVPEAETMRLTRDALGARAIAGGRRVIP